MPGTVDTSRRSRRLMIGLLGLALWGCSMSLPVKLNELAAVKETTLTESKDLPHMSMALHADGLGWQVFVTQSVTREIGTAAEEYWQYRTYDLSGRSSAKRPHNYDDICGLLLLTTPLFAPLNVDGPPYWTKWDRMASACNLTSANSSRRLHASGQIRREDKVSVEAVTEGHLFLVWQSPEQPTIHASIPLDHNTKATGTTVRLRWLAERIRRTARSPVVLRSGTVDMELIQHDRVILRRRLPVTPEDLVASLSDDRVVSVRADHWPRDLIVRVECDPQSLSSDEQGYLIQQTVLTLNHLAVPVVLRAHSLELWRADQVRFHHPEFSELPSVDPAHATGATVLLHLAVRTPFPPSRVLTIYAASITTGEILANLSAGGHESQWPLVVDMGMGELGFMLQDLLDQLSPKPVRLQPMSMPEGRP